MALIKCVAVFVFLLVCGAEALHDWSAPPIVLASGDLTANDWFGYSVAIDGLTAVVGTPTHNGVAGRVYVYEKTTAGQWKPGILIPSPSISGDTILKFGNAVAIKSTRIVVGAPYTTVGATQKGGVVVVYDKDTSTGTWTMTTVIDSPNLVAGTYFGTAVAVSGDTIVVGTPGILPEEGTPAHENVTVFEKNPTTGIWTGVPLDISGIANSGDGHNGIGWERSVAIHGSHIVIGAAYELKSGDGSGGAYTYLKNTASGGWERTELPMDPPVAGQRYGSSVAIGPSDLSNEILLAVVGGIGSVPIGIARVFTYVYPNGWTSGVNLNNSGASGTNEFGGSVDVDGSLIIVGSHRLQLDGYNTATGVAFVGTFEFDPETDVWVRTMLAPTDPAQFEGAGYAVGVSSHGIALLGTPFKNKNGSSQNHGDTYLYDASHDPPGPTPPPPGPTPPPPGPTPPPPGPTPTPPPPGSPDDGGLSTGAIVGIAVGAAVLCALLVIVGVRRNRNPHKYAPISVADAIRQLLPPP
jgi:hypothetical protein